MRAPTVCALGEGASDAAVRPGRLIAAPTDPLPSLRVGAAISRPPEPGVSTASPVKIVPCYGRAMRAPTVCALGEGASDAAVQFGRI